MSLLHNGRKVNIFIEITLTFSGFFLNVCKKYTATSNN